jgi:soluble lytic murein transglycosylase-like protein
VAIEGGRVLPFGPASTPAFAGPIDTAHTLDETAVTAPDPRHKVLAGYLARKYRIAGDATVDLVGESYAVGRAVGLDPLLILAVISVESRFNPIAESDYGAKGLMQVVPRFHLDKLAAHGGQNVVLEPRVNIRVGAQILREYIRQTGSVEEGLQLYAGAVDDPAQGYAQKVVAEKRRLTDVVARLPKAAAA